MLVRFVSLATPDNHTIALMLAVLATASMCYGNLIALMQKDFKRLLGFSGIAHAGYAMIGFVAMDQLGYSAALYYIIGYLFMVLACFIVICKVSRRRLQRRHRGVGRPAQAGATAGPDPGGRRVCSGGRSAVRRLHG